MSTERELILLCRTKIEQILNWGDSSLWTNSDFELLSEKIFEKTTVRLSVSTLKRIWGKVKYDNSPTAATLNALANFLDYASWRDFESENNKVADTPETSPKPAPRKKLPVGIFTTLALVAASLIIVLLLVKGKSPHGFDPEKAKFTHREVTDDLPNSVVFDYDISSFKNVDSVFIQQNWDPERREKVSKDGSQHTSIYYEPGYFKAKLIVNDTIMKEDIVWIKTKGWKGLLQRQETKVPVYLADQDFKRDGHFVVTSELLQRKWNTSVFTEKLASLENVRDLNADVASFDFETMVRNTSTPEESLCRRVIITLLTSEMAMIFPLTTKGCSSEVGVLTTNGWVSGKEKDLSAFGCEFANLEKLNISMKDSVLTASLNDNVIFTEKQMNPAGKIVGVRVAFEGSGEMQYAKMNGHVID